MSTDWGFACLSHDPPLVLYPDYPSRDGMADLLTRIRSGTWPTITEFAGTAIESIEDAPYAEHWSAPVKFLREHPKCRIAIVSEYGETWFTEGGLLQVSGRDERKSHRRDPSLPPGVRGALVPGVYPPEGEVRCTCYQPTLAVTHPDMTMRDGWVRCTACGGTSLASERP